MMGRVFSISLGGSAGGGGNVSGSGTANRLAKWSDASTITSSLWLEDATTGAISFTNFSSAKGTAAAPIVDIRGGGTAGTGLYTDANRQLLFTADGLLFGGFDPNGTAGLNIYNGGGTTNYCYIRALSDGMYFSTVGALNGSYNYNKGTTNTCSLNLGGINSAAQVGMVSYQTAALNNLFAVFSSSTKEGTQGKAAFATQRGGGAGTGSFTKLNAWTIKAQADQTGLGSGTTTANASTTITGSSTLFTQDLGIGDRISLSSAASTYAYVTAIASDTSLTVNTALGNGTSQTINKKTALFRATNNSDAQGLFVSDALDCAAGASAPATNATQGFLYIPACAGTPTGTPVGLTGYAALVADSTNNKIYAYLGGAWVALN